MRRFLRRWKWVDWLFVRVEAYTALLEQHGLREVVGVVVRGAVSTMLGGWTYLQGAALEGAALPIAITVAIVVFAALYWFRATHVSLRSGTSISESTRIGGEDRVSRDITQVRHEISRSLEMTDEIQPAVGRALAKIVSVMEESITGVSELADQKLRLHELRADNKILNEVLPGLHDLQHRFSRLADRFHIASALQAECASALICKDLQASLPRQLGQIEERTAEELTTFVNDADRFVDDVITITRLARLWDMSEFMAELHMWSNKAEKEFHDDHRGTSLPVEVSTARHLYAIALKRLPVTDRFLSARELAATIPSRTTRRTAQTGRY